jgi:hypothetical protein
MPFISPLLLVFRGRGPAKGGGAFYGFIILKLPGFAKEKPGFRLGKAGKTLFLFHLW